MVERIQLLRNVGQFDNVSPGQQAGLTKLALIYAENGRGKTTLANILRSLSVNNSSFIEERMRLGAANAPHVILQAKGQSFIYQNGAWKAHLPEIAVFDDNFVAQNICSGIEVAAGHKQNLHELILGAQGVALNAALKQHIDKVEQHNRALKIKEAAIPAAARGNLSVDGFCALPMTANIEAEIQAAERNLAAAREADSVSKQSIFQSFQLPVFDTTVIESILQSDLPGLQADTTAKVREHLGKLGKGAEAWVGEGMLKISAASDGETDEICPFCAQELQNSGILAHYEAYFSDAYTKLREEITSLGKAVSAAHDADIQAAFERAVREAVQNSNFWRKFMEVPTVAIDTAEIARAWKAVREPILAVLRAKLMSPLEKMALSGQVYEALKVYEGYRAAVGAASDTLLACNEQIASVKEKVAAANITTLNADLTRLKMVQARHSSAVAPLCKDYLGEKAAKKATETLRDNARKALDSYRINIFNQYETAINTYLRKFNAGFRLGSVAAQNNRGGSSVTYNVLINSVAVPLAADNGPSFKNTLSAGDRNTLALAFFFASLDHDTTLAQKIVVIDDPMTSLDEHRSLATIQEIRSLASRVHQVIVLSHSKPFLCQMWEGADKTTRCALQIIRTGQSSSIDVWDVNQDCITEHDKRHTLIQQYLNQSDPNKAREVATALRYVLEAFLRVAYPSHFPPGKLLGPFHHECRQALAGSNAILNAVDTDELGKLLEYANRFHHDSNPAYATAIISDQELVDHCERTLKFAKRG